MSRLSVVFISALALGRGVFGQEEEFNKDSFATFGGPVGAKVTACPWYHFAASGEPVLPRGPSKLGMPCRVETLKHYMKSFREGGTFTVVKDGTEMWAHAGGTHNHANDPDLDSVMVNMVPTQPKRSSMVQLNMQRRLAAGAEAGTSSLSLSKVRLRISTGDICMSGGGYGEKEVALPLSQEAVNFIQNDLCLCKADGVQSICFQEEKWGDEGITGWLPMPGSKNLGRPGDTYLGLPQDGMLLGWRHDTIEQLRSLDTNSDGVLTLGEVLHQARLRGVNQDWLDLMKKVDPCRIVNTQRDAYMWLQALPNIAEHPGQLAAELQAAKVWPDHPGDALLWGPGYDWLRQKKYHLPFMSDQKACRDLWDSAASQV
jgi:hypothetical protein